MHSVAEKEDVANSTEGACSTRRSMSPAILGYLAFHISRYYREGREAALISDTKKRVLPGYLAKLL